MATSLHLAIASTTSLPGRVDRNLAQIAGFADQARRDGAQLLLTPELSASGYGNYPEVLATAETAGDGIIYETLKSIAAATGVVIAAGFVEQNQSRRHLAHYVVYPDGTFVVQRKHRITSVEMPLEPVVAQQGPFGQDGTGQPVSIEIQPFTVDGVRCAIAICADSGIDGLDAYLDQHQVKVLLIPVAAGGDKSQRLTLADLAKAEGPERYVVALQQVFFPGQGIARCVRYQRAMAAVNLCGFDGHKHAHLGHGMIITPWGEVPAFFHGLPVLERQRPCYAHARVEL